MIEFAKEDYNMVAVEKETNLSSFKTKKEFRVFGLSQDDNPPLGIHYNMDSKEWKATEIEEDLRNFFKANGLVIDFDHHNNELFSIGLRRDIRENPALAASLIQTIVYHLEGRLELDNTFKISGLNKFVITESPSSGN